MCININNNTIINFYNLFSEKNDFLFYNKNNYKNAQELQERTYYWKYHQIWWKQ